MQTIMCEEAWAPRRESFTFRCVRSTGQRWTFVVDRAALENIGPAGTDLAQIFEKNRARIYEAARRRMVVGQPDQQQVITWADIASVG